MKVYSTENIRNIVLLGHAGSGKTTLAECMLFEAGEINRRGTVEEGNTVSDHYNIEKSRGNSVFSTLMHAEWKDSKINIVDTPGYDDFIGEVVSGMKVAGTAVLVLNAQHGVEVATESIWEYIESLNTPTLIAVNQVDHEKADFNTTLEQAQERFGDKVTVFQFPIETGDGFDSIVDVLRMVMYKFSKDGGKPEKHPIPDSVKDQANEYRAALIEKVAEYDEDLMESFFEDENLTEEELTRGLRASMLEQQLVPLFICSAARNMGSGRIMGFLNDIAPAPKDRQIKFENGESGPMDSSARPVVFFYKSLSEPHMGEMFYFKVYQGVVESGTDLYNHHSTTSERLGQLYVVNGKNRTSVEKLYAGDLGMAVKLKNTRVNDTLSPKDHEVEIARINFPPSRIRMAVKPPNKGDLEKMAVGLQQMQKEDPTLKVEQSAELRQTIIHGQGQMHLNMIKYRMEVLYGLELEFEAPRIPYRETIRNKADAHYRHKKQSGGSGQFGEVHMLVEPYYEGMPPPENLNVRSIEEHPLPWGGKLVFQNCTFGGSIDTKYMNAIVKGIMNVMENGPVTGSYVRDIRVSVYDGKMHSVDSNDMAFQLAAQGAMKQAFAQARPQVLEPIHEIEVLCSSDTMGDIMSDLNTRRAIIKDIGTKGHYQKIVAHIPLETLYKYSSTLRALSQGRAKHTSKFVEYGVVPSNVQEELQKAHQEAATS